MVSPDWDMLVSPTNTAVSSGGSSTDEDAVHTNVANEIANVAALGINDHLKQSDVVIIEDA